jgi:hypothetical protein
VAVVYLLLALKAGYVMIGLLANQMALAGEHAMMPAVAALQGASHKN